MGGEIFQLAFVASRRPGVPAGTLREHEEHLANSRTIFAEAKVTGLMLSKGPRFLYHLEGEEPQVMKLFHRIQSDRRVHGIVVLRRRFADQRAFAKWDFALDNRSRTSVSKSLIEQVREFVADAPADIQQYFLSFAKLEPSRAA